MTCRFVHHVVRDEPSTRVSIFKTAVNNLLYRGLQISLTGLMALLIIPVILQIFSRYIGIIPRYIWTEEVSRFCLVWIIMLGAMIAVRDGTHFDLDILPKAKTAQRRNRLRR